MKGSAPRAVVTTFNIKEQESGLVSGKEYRRFRSNCSSVRLAKRISGTQERRPRKVNVRHIPWGPRRHRPSMVGGVW